MRQVLIVLLLFPFTLMSSSAGAVSKLDERIARSAEWQRLLHYRKNFFGHLRSDLAGPEFFFAPDGRTNPESELRASVAAFGRDIRVGKLKQHPQCAFPLRYRFLKKELGLKLQDVPCPQFEEFLARFHHPKSVTLIFSSAYSDNPASMFGHTFLRVNSGEQMDLLNQGVSYAANVGPNENPLVFYWLGVTGGYPGSFSVVPYYAKVNEYNHAEARDLWEYELSLSEEETLSLLRHIWELETNSWFDYYFFDENCSFQLLALLEVVKPDWTLTNTPPWVIPGETVKIVTRTPGAVRSVKFRPSYRQKMLDRFLKLNDSERDDLKGILSGSRQLASADRATIDALSAVLFYEKQKTDGKLSSSKQALLTASLLQRSQLASISEDSISVPAWDNRPDLGHGAARLSSSSGIASLSNQGSLFFQELHWRSAYHDLLNDDLGFPRFSQIEFPSLTLRYYPKSADFRIERIGLLSVVSLSPVNPLERKPSWEFSLGYVSPKDFGCLTCHTLQARGGIGFSSDVVSRNTVVYGMVLANAEAGSSLQKGYRFGPGVRIASLSNPLNRYKVRIGYQLISDLWQQDRSSFFYQADLEQSYRLSALWEMRATGTLERGYQEGKISLNYYF